MSIEGRRLPPDLPKRIDGKAKIPWNSHYFKIPDELIKHPYAPVNKTEIAFGKPVELFSWLASTEMRAKIIGDRPMRIGRYIGKDSPPTDDNLLQEWVSEHIQIRPFLGNDAEFKLEQFYDSFMGHEFDDPAFHTRCAFQITAPEYSTQFRWSNADDMRNAANDLAPHAVWVTPFDDSHDAYLNVYSTLSWIHHHLEKNAEEIFTRFFTPIFIEALRHHGFEVPDDLESFVRIFLSRGTEEKIIPSLESIWSDYYGNRPTGFFSMVDIISEV